jgi:ubiquinone/menaquinone biosynthesis C-methylase UbiE
MANGGNKLPQFMLPTGFAGRLMLRVMNVMHGAIYKNTADVLRPQPDDDVLEVGCGNGHFLKKYASSARSVAGLDLSELCIESAKKKHRKRIGAGTAEFVRGDAAQLPWEDSRFSAVTSMGSFVGFRQPLQSLKELHRVLRPGGRVVLSIEWNAEDGRDHANEIEKYGMHIWTEGEVREMMAEAGLSQVTIEYRKAMAMPKMMFATGVKA